MILIVAWVRDGGAEISTVLRLHLLYRVLAYTAKHVSVYVLLEMMFGFYVLLELIFDFMFCSR